MEFVSIEIALPVNLAAYPVGRNRTDTSLSGRAYYAGTQVASIPYLAREEQPARPWNSKTIERNCSRPNGRILQIDELYGISGR